MVEGSDDSHSPDVLAPEMEPSSVLKTYIGAVAPGEEHMAGTSAGCGKAPVKPAPEPEVKGVGLELGLIAMIEVKIEARVGAKIGEKVGTKVEAKVGSLEAPKDAGLLSDLLTTGLESG